MRLITYSNLYPSVDMPRHGIFVEERLRHLVAAGGLTATVCALRPENTLNPKTYMTGGRAGKDEFRHGITVAYATVPTLPFVTNWIDPLIWARASQYAVEGLVDGQSSGVVLDAHFLYPDAVAAVILGGRLGLPVVMTARGSDVNLKCENAIMRRWILWAAARSSAVITVSQALADRLVELGVLPDKVSALPNGVDLDKFVPCCDARSVPGIDTAGTVLLSAGHLVEGKGHHVVIEALSELPGATLLIVGEGPMEQVLRGLADEHGVAERVRFLGYVPHDEMLGVYNAADFTVLASANEGMPNVMLESIACGTRVIATNVGGIGEVLKSPLAGTLMPDRSPQSVRESVLTLQQGGHDRQATRQYAEQYSWDSTVQKQLELYERVVTR